MGAAELLDYPRHMLRGLVLEEGAPTSHIVIVARAIGIPTVGQVKGAVSMSENGDAIIIDGEGRPDPLEAAARYRGGLFGKSAFSARAASSSIATCARSRR